MKHIFLKVIILCIVLPFSGKANFSPVQDEGKYKVHADLLNMENDRVLVEVVVPIVMEKEVIYNMPRMVPGTYKVYDFGRFVNDFVAIGSRGDTLDVEQMNVNQWRITNAQDLYKIVYWADDTYDEKGSDIFAPAGTDFNDKVCLLNNFSFIGYLEGYKKMPFEFVVSKPTQFSASTSLDFRTVNENEDVFEAKDYFELHDCPILYASPDNSVEYIGDTEVVISVYSPKGNLDSKNIMEGIVNVFHAASDYLGGDLPADKYTVLIYGMDIKQSMMGVGALEHHTSTVVNVPDISDQYMKMFSDGGMIQLLRDIVSHEFFHIVTPLNIHSEQIADYDFMNPQMSKHLWLYEGITEYNANISQVRSGILTEEQFMNNMKTKMKNDRTFNPHVPFTSLSTYALSVYEDQYLNVYEKGALVGMCLDLTLRKESGGDYGLANLLMELSATYGKDTFFVDDNLFEIIANHVESDEVREFFARYVESSEPLPLDKLLEPVGYNYSAEKIAKKVSDGSIELNVMDGDIVVVSVNSNDAFIRELGLMPRDMLISLNGQKINESNYESLFSSFFKNAKVGDEIEIIIKRNEGKTVKRKLTATVQNSITKELDVLEKIESATVKQQALKKAWINN